MEMYLTIVQGFYYFVTGIWPLINVDTFMHVTGHKTDVWLVKTVGILVAVIGLALINTGIRDDFTQGVLILAIGSAFGLMLIDIVYVSKKVISKIYLLDAAAEIIIVISWLLLLRFWYHA